MGGDKTKRRSEQYIYPSLPMSAILNAEQSPAEIWRGFVVS
jgi:hypothetical protein